MRRYFNARAGSCQTFIFRGMQGNQNNFASFDQCATRCTSTTLVCVKGSKSDSFAGNPCGNGSPYSSGGASQSCSVMQGSSACPGNYYCHVGPTVTNSVCCPVTGKSKEYCLIRQILSRKCLRTAAGKRRRRGADSAMVLQYEHEAVSDLRLHGRWGQSEQLLEHERLHEYV